MKTMNFLLTAALVLLLGACTHEDQSISEELEAVKFRGMKHQKQTVYLELDFHQAYLIREDRQIRDEMIRLKEAFEKGAKGHDRFEKLQENLERNSLDFRVNDKLSDRFRRRPIGGGRPGRPCGEVPDPTKVCPFPRRHLGDIVVHIEQWQKGRIDLFTAEGKRCGAMVQMKPVSGGDEQLAQVIIEGDLELAQQIRFTKQSKNGTLFSYTLPIE